MYYVYVLYSRKFNKLYKGSCKNLKIRFKQHLSGKVKSTKIIKDWELIYYQGFKNKTDALVEERFLKLERAGKG